MIEATISPSIYTILRLIQPNVSRKKKCMVGLRSTVSWYVSHVSNITLLVLLHFCSRSINASSSAGFEF